MKHIIVDHLRPQDSLTRVEATHAAYRKTCVACYKRKWMKPANAKAP